MTLEQYEAAISRALCKAFPDASARARLLQEWSAKIRTSWAAARDASGVARDIVKYERGS